MASDLGLNDHHQSAIVNYLRFARYQRNQCLRAITASFEDVKDTRLLEQTYTVDEVEEVLRDLLVTVRSEVESELLNTGHTNAILLRQLFQQAQQWHLKLQPDTSELENSDLLKQIKVFEEEEGIGIKKEQTSPVKTKLQPLNESSGAGLLQMKIDQLTKDNVNLKDQMKQIESRALAALQEKSSLTAQVTELTAQQEAMKLGQKQAGGDSTSAEELKALQTQLKEMQLKLTGSESGRMSQQMTEQDLTATKHRLLDVQSQLELAEKELEKKFSQTTAYNNLKKMLGKKNDQIKDLRKRLEMYDPQTNEDAD